MLSMQLHEYIRTLHAFCFSGGLSHEPFIDDEQGKPSAHHRFRVRFDFIFSYTWNLLQNEIRHLGHVLQDLKPCQMQQGRHRRAGFHECLFQEAGQQETMHGIP
jgi:hypothetical protein